MDNFIRWSTLLELNAPNKILGDKGWVFFITDFVRDLKSKDLKYVISQPVLNGMFLGPGIVSFVLDEDEISELFIPLEKTLEEYEEELKDRYFKNSN